MIAEVVALKEYEAQVAPLLDEDERTAMEFFIACNPEAHPVVSGTGGFGKARWSRHRGGKSGGFRTIYFFIDPPGRIYMASIYAKNRKATLSGADVNALAKVAAGIKTVVGTERKK